MLNAVTGVNGASKTAYVVTQLFDIERKNKVNLKKNILIFNHNKQFFEKYLDDFAYCEIEEGSGEEIKIVLEILPPEYFYMLGQDFEDLRPDDYYVRVIRYNEIIQRIRERGEPEDFTFFQPVRTIYTNIKALKIDYVRALKVDWRECPDGSIIVIDEVQLVPPYNSNKVKDDPIVQELTIHRHRGFDFWFITQAPSYIHPTIKELISCHYHVTRPYWRTPKVYQYGSLRAYPNTLVNKINCEAKFDFKPKDFIFKLYKSTVVDTSKKRFPRNVIFFVVFVFLAFCIFIYGISGGSGFLGHFFGSEKKQTAAQKQASNSTHSTSAPAISPVEIKNPEQDCRKAENLDNQVCKDWFNRITKDGANVQSQSVSYDVNHPFDDSAIVKTIKYDVVNKPRFAGCVHVDGRYYAYTEQGTRLKVSQSDCQKVMSGDRPYDYFTSPHSSNSSAVASNSISDNVRSDQEQSSVDVSRQTENKQVFNIPNNPTFKETDITKPSI